MALEYFINDSDFKKKCYNIFLSLVLSDPMLKGVFQKDFNTAVNGAVKLVGNDVPPEVMGVVTEMVFQLGYTGTSKFKKTLAYIKEGSYYQASKEMLDSDWANQTEERAIALSKIMANIQ